jgi:hypothetical protein
MHCAFARPTRLLRARHHSHRHNYTVYVHAQAARTPLTTFKASGVCRGIGSLLSRYIRGMAATGGWATHVGAPAYSHVFRITRLVFLPYTYVLLTTTKRGVTSKTPDVNYPHLSSLDFVGLVR